jgi:hypothetical protein
MPNGRSTILNFLSALLKTLDPAIDVEISEDQTTLTASNISEATMVNLVIPTNNPSFQNSYLYLQDIHVYLNNNLVPTKIFGLLEIVETRIQLSDATAYCSSQVTHKPFMNGFKNNITMSQLVDTLSNLSRATVTTTGKTKHYTLIFDPKNIALAIGKAMVKPEQKHGLSSNTVARDLGVH